MQHYGKVEVIQFGKEDLSNGDWLVCQLAIDGKLAIPFSIHKADWRSYKSEDELMQMLTRQSLGLLDEFGDARYAQIAA